MGRRGNREGTAYQIADGRWEGQITVSHPITGKSKRLKLRGTNGESKTALLRRLRAKAEDWDRQQRTHAPNTIADLMAEWLAHEGEDQKSPSWFATCQLLIDRHILATADRTNLGDVPVAALTPRMVEAWQHGLVGRDRQPLSKASKQHVRRQLSLAFDRAVRHGYVDRNPVELAAKPKKKQGPTRRQPPRLLEVGDLQAIIEAAEGHRLQTWVRTAAVTGMRPGEVSALTWAAIDWDRGQVAVETSLVWVNSQPSLKTTKTDTPRWAKLHDGTLTALRAHRKQRLEEQILMGDRWPAEWSELVFVSTNGTPLNPSNLRRWVADLADAAGVEGVVRPYDFRHTVATRLIEAGVPPHEVQKLMGHNDIRTLQNYMHQTSATATAATRMAELIG